MAGGIRAIGAAILIASTGATYGATWTGAELLSDSSVSFPNGAPTAVGQSVVFGPNAFSGAKLIRIPVLAPQAASVATIQVRVTATLTRLACDTSSNCAVSAGDWDPILGLGDGVYVVGGSIGDPEFQFGLGATDPALIGAAERDDGGSDRVLTGAGQTLFTKDGFPVIGESIVAAFLFTLGLAETRLSADVLGGSGIGVFARQIDQTRGIDFFLVQDDGGERYQLDALSIVVVPEPGANHLLVVGLLLLMMANARFVPKRTIGYAAVGRRFAG